MAVEVVRRLLVLLPPLLAAVGCAPEAAEVAASQGEVLQVAHLPSPLHGTLHGTLTAAERIRAELEAHADRAGTADAVERGPTTEDPAGVLHAAYAAREHAPMWTSGAALEPRGRALLELLEATSREGIDPERYGVQRMRRLEARLDAGTDGAGGPGAEAAAAARLDVLLTSGFLAHARDLARGVADPEQEDEQWTIERPDPPLAELLAEALEGAHPASVLRGLRPVVPQYLRLVNGLARLRAAAEAGGWPQMPEAAAGADLLRRGDRDRAVTLLRARLNADEEGARFALAPLAGDRFDGEVEEALQHFQRRHGLAADGVLGPETRAALNVPVEARILALELNLDRWRRLPARLEERYILVNVAGFELEVVEDGETTLSMRIVAGAPAWQTPSFRDDITFLVVNPWWYVPERIAQLEIGPRAAQDSTYLDSMGYEALDDVPGVPFRQRPGPANALGELKFMFPNAFSIYLHDTPAGGLFDRSRRAFSHGCIRVEDPWALANHLMRGNPLWNEERMRRFVGGVDEVEVRLPEPVPIYILYFTAWVTEEGTPHFYDDVYGRDAALKPT